MELKLLKVVFVFAFIISLFISINNISHWGLSYDEALFINGVMRKDNITFISKRYHGIVLMVFQYIGALKSWCYIPIFKLFGVNLLSIRLPMIIILYTNYFLIFIISKKYFNLKIVLSLMILLFTDLSFIHLHKIDNGPNAIETFLKLFSIFVITRAGFKGQNLILLLILAFGIFNKLNFIWFVNAFYFTIFISLVLKYFKVKKSEKNVKNLYLSKSIIHLVNYSILLTFFVYLIIKQNVQSNMPKTWGGLLSQFYSQITNIVNAIGNFTYENYYGWTSTHPYSFAVILVVLVFVFLVNIYFVVGWEINISDLNFKLYLFILILIIQLIITKEAFHLWHIVILYPFIQLLVLNTLSITFNKKYNYAYYCVFFLWLCNNTYANIEFYNKSKTECNAALFESKINNLIYFIQNRKEKYIISLGWGIHNQLMVNDISSKKYIEFINTNYEQNFKSVIDDNLNLKAEYNKVLIIINRKAVFDQELVKIYSMENYIKSNGLALKSVQTINDNCSKPLFDIYKIIKQASL